MKTKFILLSLLFLGIVYQGWAQSPVKSTAKSQVRQLTGVSKADQEAIKQLAGDQFNVSFTGNTAIFTEKVKLNDVRVSGGKQLGGIGDVAIIVVDVANQGTNNTNNTKNSGSINMGVLSSRLKTQNIQQISAIMQKYQ
ncbi:hypothetical protein GCM10023231_19900 [Olivibacter ginsenosidimutans]|uniref:DUF4251 domain-containing protein n=1 Tax=Olivibacter ginsenosidimutans TaxID=1176537 RepID=A0ABP9B850_9SPHI